MLQVVELKHIENYFISQGVKYYDVRLELIDHVASAIEERMAIESVDIFGIAYQDEIQKWKGPKLAQFINERESELKKMWQSKATAYLLDFFKLPKVLFLLGLTFTLFYFLSIPSNFDYLIPKFLGGVYFLYLVGLTFISYNIFISSHSFPPPLLSVNAYNSTISLGTVMSGCIIFQMFDVPLQYSPYMAFTISILISAGCLLIYACAYVFPKWLKADTLKYYRHLNIV